MIQQGECGRTLQTKPVMVSNRLYEKACNLKCNEDPCLSIVVPVFNLSHVVLYTYRAIESALNKCSISYEVIFVDDGSTDDTYMKLLDNLRYDDRVRVYRLPFNKGKGFALFHGFRRARGEIVVFFDGDLDINPRVIPVLYSIVRLNIGDIAILSKWHPQSITRYTFIRLLFSKLFNKLSMLLLGLRLKDTQTGAKAFKSEVLKALAPQLIIKRYAFDIELLVLASKRNYRIIEVPSPWPIKLNSSFKLDEIWRMLLDILSITYRVRITKRIR